MERIGGAGDVPRTGRNPSPKKGYDMGNYICPLQQQFIRKKFINMALITSGKSFLRDLDKAGALAVYTPLEGGAEGRYQRRLRAAGYLPFSITARGLGDVAAYLTDVHGVRPPHLGKKTIGQEAAVGQVTFVPPMVSYQLAHLPPTAKGLALWIIEGFVLSRQELGYLVGLAQQEPKLQIIVELGGDRNFRWTPLADQLAN